jgi:hypothetical protein
LDAAEVLAGPYFDRMIEFRVYDPLPPVETSHLPVFTDENLQWWWHGAETDKALMGGGS